MCYSKPYEDLPSFISQWLKDDCPAWANRCSCNTPCHRPHINVRRILDYSTQWSRRYEDFRVDLERDLQGQRRSDAFYDDRMYVDTELISVTLLEPSDNHPGIAVTAPTVERAFIGIRSWMELDFPRPGPGLEVYVSCRLRTKKSCGRDKYRREMARVGSPIETESGIDRENKHNSLQARAENHAASEDFLKIPKRRTQSAILRDNRKAVSRRMSGG